MKLCRNFSKALFYVILVACISVFGTLLYLDSSLSDSFKIKKGENLKLDTGVPITAEYNGIELSNKNTFERIGEDYNVELKLFGIIPISTVNVQVVDELQVAVLGTAFGMKLYTEGVLVIELTQVETAEGTVKPAKAGGIKVGDYIISVNGAEITSNEDLSELVESSGGEKMNFLVNRNGKKMNIYLTPAFSKETGSYKIGIWIRDSSAGIGTLTFYSPSSNIICGLGHGICDEDTGTLLSAQYGELVSAEIIGVVKGKIGSPGQLKGRLGFKSLGNIDLNCEMGVYSFAKGGISVKSLIEVALKQEVENGKAQVLCTIDGDIPKYYDCQITLRSSAFHSKTQNMYVTVTDETLLNATGGIVQGLSGSPLIQNGKLIGAVTHVLVDDPTKGYAIFAENMLETAQGVANKQMKEAS